MKTPYYEQIGVAMTCRSFDEYLHMFDLTPIELDRGKILDVAAGGSSFTAEATMRGYEAIAVDPRYANDVEQWIIEAGEEIDVSTAKLDKLKASFDWSYYGSVDRHRSGRELSLTKFSEHLDTVEGSGCYKAGLLPELPFEDKSFSLVLCSHFLFLYAEQFGFEFHKQSVLELMRLCQSDGEVRIYPLISLKWDTFGSLDELMDIIIQHGGKPEVMPSKLPFIPGSDKYLRIRM